ncbi:hypothetical protein EON63_01665 [archaeon]|nr:MAG: hypothetical protein EON63_01665 [archaeon]
MAFHDKVQSKPFPPKLIKPTVSNVVNHGDHHHGDIHDFSFTHKDYITITDRLRDPKLVVNPSRVGCYIVHWAGCGDPTKELNVNDFGEFGVWV